MKQRIKMASVVFEKQLANINKGLQSLRSMNKELNKFEKGSNSTKMLRGGGLLKALKKRNLALSLWH